MPETYRILDVNGDMIADGFSLRNAVRYLRSGGRGGKFLHCPETGDVQVLVVGGGGFVDQFRPATSAERARIGIPAPVDLMCA